MHKFIVMEGTDGSGKSTQIDLLCRRFDSMGLKYKRLRFPRYGQPSSALLKMYLAGDFGEQADSVNPYAASVFFSVDRFASFRTDWQEAYEAGEIIISDRYTTSNAVHQASKLSGSEREKFLDWLFDFEYRLLELPAPDKVLFLDMPAEETFKLIDKRHGAADIDEKDHAYLQRCRENALDICRRYGWDKIDCAGPQGLRTPEEINREVFEKIGQVLQIG